MSSTFARRCWPESKRLTAAMPSIPMAQATRSWLKHSSNSGRLFKPLGSSDCWRVRWLSRFVEEDKATFFVACHDIDSAVTVEITCGKLSANA